MQSQGPCPSSCFSILTFLLPYLQNQSWVTSKSVTLLIRAKETGREENTFLLLLLLPFPLPLPSPSSRKPSRSFTQYFSLMLIGLVLLCMTTSAMEAGCANLLRLPSQSTTNWVTSTTEMCVSQFEMLEVWDGGVGWDDSIRGCEREPVPSPSSSFLAACQQL